jgi:nucleoside-diphosphate-sugar epimerase
MRILIVGGTGFIGPYVAKEFYERGHEVTVFHRGRHESVLLPDVRHFRSEQAALPVLSYPSDLLRDEFELVVHMIPMGEADMRAAVQTFAGHAARLVALSSGDVYRAYGRFTGLERGPVEQDLLHEDSPLREILYPYRAQAKSAAEVNYYYEKILVERELLGQLRLPGTVLRLPKVYGPGGNANLATIYGYRDRPSWRWTHGYVENISAAIVLAALHPAGVNRVFNVGEAVTPTIAERLQTLPASTLQPIQANGYDFRQNIAYDTTRIRGELGYAEPVPYEEGLKRTFRAAATEP